MFKKRGVSSIIGYVLLVSFMLVLGVLIYLLLKTYVPGEVDNCPDETSILIKSYECNPDQLILNLKNDGNFNIGGYFIYATTSPQQETATLDLSRNITPSIYRLYPRGVKFGEVGEEENSLTPDQNSTGIYNLTGLAQIYSMEITPIRWQEEKNKNLLVTCTNAKIKKTIDCSGICTPNCGTRICGLDPTGCGTSCGNCTIGTCNSLGQCVTGCINECNLLGETQCSSVNIQTCVSDYDTDSCYEWNAPIACPLGQTCTGGICITPSQIGPIIINHTTADISKVPLCWIDKAKNDLRIAYSHTSHGEQLLVGMEALEDYDPSNYDVTRGWDWPESSWNSDKLYVREYQGWYTSIDMFPGIIDQTSVITRSSDMSHSLTFWADLTRTYLNGDSGEGLGANINIVMWSWCHTTDGNNSNILPSNIQTYYIDEIESLSEEYPDKKFVAMTFHSTNGGDSDPNNEFIRNWCYNNPNCVLFDFADIEEYDPLDNSYYGVGSQSLRYDFNRDTIPEGNWATDYLGLGSGVVTPENDALVQILKQPSYFSCSYSPVLNITTGELKVGESTDSVLNCALKGQATWWMMARLAGWDGISTTCP